MDKTALLLLLDANLAIMNSQKVQFDELRAAGDISAAMAQAVRTMHSALAVVKVMEEIVHEGIQ